MTWTVDHNSTLGIKSNQQTHMQIVSPSPIETKAISIRESFEIALLKSSADLLQSLFGSETAISGKAIAPSQSVLS
jgi:hypothetical protein